MLTIIIVTRSARIIKGKGVNYFRLFILISENNQDMDIKNTSQILAQNLKELRKNKGISTEKLSQKIKELYGISISADSLANYEVDDQHHTKYLKNMGMRVEYLQCLSDFYGVTVDYLLGNTKDPSPKPCAVDVLGLSTNAIEALSGKHAPLTKKIFGEDKMYTNWANTCRKYHTLDLRQMVNLLLEDERTHEAMDFLQLASELLFSYHSSKEFLQIKNGDGSYIEGWNIEEGRITIPPYIAARSFVDYGKKIASDVLGSFFEDYYDWHAPKMEENNGEHHKD